MGCREWTSTRYMRGKFIVWTITPEAQQEYVARHQKVYKNRLYRHEGSGRLYFVEADGDERKCRKKADDRSVMDDSDTMPSEKMGEPACHQGDEKRSDAIRLIVPEDQQLRHGVATKAMLHASPAKALELPGPPLGHDAQRWVQRVKTARCAL